MFTGYAHVFTHATDREKSKDIEVDLWRFVVPAAVATQQPEQRLQLDGGEDEGSGAGSEEDED